MAIGLFLLALPHVLALLCLWGCIAAGRKRRLITDLPTSKTTGVFIGLVELKGTAQTGRPLTSFLRVTPCVWYSWTVEEHWSRTVTESYTDSEGKTQTRTREESGWTTVAEGGEQRPFYLRDDEGVVRVDPTGAKIEPICVFDETCDRGDPLYYGKAPRSAVSNSDHRRRFVEQAIPLHAPIYVVGRARECADVVAPEIAQGPHTPMFLISTRTEAQVAGGLAWRYWVFGILGLVLVLGFWLVILRGDNPPRLEALRLRMPLAVGGGYLGLWLLSWVWMAYNSLVGLRQRVRQAWANVDVQLKRRNDLIPNLVKTVEGLRDYEQRLQVDLAALRAQLSATAPSQPGPDPAGCVTRLAAIVERYPELRANEVFMNLQRNLVETEQRISLARGYFNEAASFYNGRLAVVPDCILAALAGLRPQPLITATDFERAEVKINLENAATPAPVA